MFAVRFPAMFRNTFLVIIFLILVSETTAQEEKTTKILLEQADAWNYNKAIQEDVQRILGNVIFSHDSAYLYCDSAYLNDKENLVTAYGNVRIKLSDTLNLYSDSLRYNGNTKIAHANSNVKLIDNQTILTTDTLVFDRKTQIAQYDYWGKIVNDKNILISKHGYYYTDKKEFFFKEKVILLNPDYFMRSDTLMYNTVTEVAYFFGPSDIVSKDKEDSIYCENGWYNTRNDAARFRDRGKIYHLATLLTGDSLYYERKNGYGQVFKKALLVDTVQNILLKGNYGELQRSRGFAFMTDSAVAVLVEKQDSLFCHSDTVRASFDSTDKIRKVYFFYRVKFFRSDLQGMSDSLIYNAPDSTLIMYKEPVLWSGLNQLSSDSIKLTIRDGQADSLKMSNAVFIISRDDSSRFNQIKGRILLAKFRNNELYKINVIGNAETIYYAREEDRTLIGVNKAVAGRMLIFLKDNQISSITYIDKPEAHLYPEKMLPEPERKLRNFKWVEDRRPKRKQDIFIW